ncbi:hypothetical protein [Brochothrix thermosphacta]|uniref:hypothetical protein n=1 Tax=Brochothrix thermosphacta TaxID=2756 RepID=UPI0039B104A4
MSRAIYKPINWEDAARAMRENNTESLFIELEDGTLTRAAGFRLEVGRLTEESWYLRCEQEDEFECRPEQK